MKRILALGAHPDDIEVGCAGLLQQHAETKMVVLSQGEAGGDPQKRVEEGRRAAEKLGSQIQFWEFPDTKLPKSEVIRALELEIRSFKPDIVLTMARNDTHQDHTTVFESTLVATRATPCTVLSYMGPSSAQYFHPTWFVPMTAEQMQVKLDVIACHETQSARDYLKPDYLLNTGEYWARVTRSGYMFVEPYELIKHWEKL